MSAEWLAAAEDYGSCPSALPEVEELAEPAATPRSTRRRKVGVAALLVAVGGLALPLTVGDVQEGDRQVSHT